jgi:hypothetical protein
MRRVSKPHIFDMPHRIPIENPSTIDKLYLKLYYLRFFAFEGLYDAEQQ